jgi:Glycosyl transferase family 2
LSQDGPGDEVRAAAEARAAARAARDWATADRLRGEIEAAGWKVVDAGVSYRLERAHPPDVVDGGTVRYGRSDAVPSLLGEPATRTATVAIVAREDPAGALRAARSALATSPDTQVVVVADGLDDAAGDALAAFAALGSDADGGRFELLRTSAPLGHGAALNAAARRAAGRIVVVLDPSIELSGSVVAPLAAALDDPNVAIAGPLGLTSSDLRHFEEASRGPAAAIEGYLQAFRREDLVARGPFDEAFRFYRNLDIWWSLVLRDEGRGATPRRAAVVEDLPIRRHEHVAWTATPAAVRDRRSKRNFYRILDRFRDRLDLAVPPAASGS